MQTHANAGVDAYETPRRGRIKGVTNAKSEWIRFPLTLMRTHKRIPNLTSASVTLCEQISGHVAMSPIS